MSTKPPPRLRDDPAVESELRSDLEHAAAQPYPYYDRAAGLLALQAGVSALEVSAASAGAAASSSQAPPAANSALSQAAAAKNAVAQAAAAKNATLLGSASAKIGIAAVSAAVIATGAAVWPSADAPQRKEPAHAAPRTAAPAPTQPSAAMDRQQPQSPQRSAAEPPPPRSALGVRAPQEDRAADDAELQREIAELGRIKALLDRDPAMAFRLAEAGHRRFRGGMLRQEREGLAVLALFELGRRHQAVARAREFLKRYPQSPLRERMTQALDRRSDRSGP